MKSIQNYIRNEWKYWLAACLIVITMGYVNGAEARPVLKAQANGMQFYQDYDANTWTMRYNGLDVDLDETFDDIKVIWKGYYKNRPIVLIAGQQGQMCEMAFRLYWYNEPDTKRWPVVPHSDYKVGPCYAKKISVSVTKDVAHITYDGKTRHVPLN